MAGSDNVVPLPYGDFEIAINAVASAINDPAALQQRWRRFLASSEIIASLSLDQIQRVLLLIPINFDYVMTSVEESTAADVTAHHFPEIQELANRAAQSEELNQIFADISASEDRRDEALKTIVKQLESRANDYAIFVPTLLLPFMRYIDVVESHFGNDNPFKYLSRFLRCGLYSRSHSYGVLEGSYWLDNKIVAQLLADLKRVPALRRFEKEISFFERYATGIKHVIDERAIFLKQIMAELFELEFDSSFRAGLWTEVCGFLLDRHQWSDVIQLTQFFGGINNCIERSAVDGLTPTWDRALAAKIRNGSLIRGDIQGLLLGLGDWFEDEVFEEVKAVMSTLERNQMRVGIFSIEWLNETGLFSKWEFPYLEVIDVPVLDVGRCIAGTEEGCTNAEFIDVVLSHYQDPRYFRLCDALISVLLLRYLSHWTGWRINEISKFSSAAAIRMLLEHLSRIPAEYRRFSSVTIDLLRQLAAGYEGPDQERFHSLLEVAVDYAPVAPPVRAEASLQVRAREQVKGLVGDVWGKLDAESAAELIAAEVAWLQIGGKLEKWPKEVPMLRRDCVHNLCCAFERELRKSVRLIFEQINIPWFDVFKGKLPSLNEMRRQVFSWEGSLTSDQRAKIERYELYRYFSVKAFIDLTEIRNIRNRAAHGGETVTVLDVVTIRELILNGNAFHAMLGWIDDSSALRGPERP